MAYRQIGLVTIRCGQCGADLGTYMFGGISTATCVKCQRLNEELERNKNAPVIDPVTTHAVPGENFVIVTGTPPPVAEERPETAFDTEAKNLFNRAKKAVTKKKRK